LPDDRVLVEQAGRLDGDGRVLRTEGHDFELNGQGGAAGREGECLRAVDGRAGYVDADAIQLGRDREVAPHGDDDFGIVLALAGRRQNDGEREQRE
jgi:hypothetical protein